MDNLVDLLRDMRYDSSNIPALLPKIVSGQRAIFAAIEAGDSTAAGQAMKEHLDSVARRVKDYWQRKNESTAGENP